MASFCSASIETIIYENQKAYYDTLGKADKENSSNAFIEFMLDIILETLTLYKMNTMSNVVDLPENLTQAERKVYLVIHQYMKTHTSITATVLSKLIGKSAPTARKYLSNFALLGLMQAQGSNKNRTYMLTKE